MEVHYIEVLLYLFLMKVLYCTFICSCYKNYLLKLFPSVGQWRLESVKSVIFD